VLVEKFIDMDICKQSPLNISDYQKYLGDVCSDVSRVWKLRPVVTHSLY